jgi:hypothetical protein
MTTSCGPRNVGGGGGIPDGGGYMVEGPEGGTYDPGAYDRVGGPGGGMYDPGTYETVGGITGDKLSVDERKAG